MKKNGRIKITAFLSILILGILLISGLSQITSQDAGPGIISSPEPDLAHGRSSVENKTNENAEVDTINTFATGSTHYTVLAEPDGNNIYLAVPPDSKVLNATMRMTGRVPEPVNKYVVGTDPQYVSGADFDKDGNLDLVIADQQKHKLSILLGDGKLHFSLLADYPTGEQPTWGTINDFNNDDYSDIATANEGGNTITVYESAAKGDGTFQNKKHYKIGDIPYSITSTDLNGDGWVDLASISNNDDKLWINLNEKSKTTSFLDATELTIDQSPVGLTHGDLDNDGDSDLITIHVGATYVMGGKTFSDIVSVYFNDGNGKFNSTNRLDYIVGKKPENVVTADFNGDGWLDIATSNNVGHNVSVLLNKGKGDGKLENTINYSLIDHAKSGRSLRVGDIDGDGDIDIVSICGIMNYITVLRNHGDGTFARFIDYIGGHSPTDLFLGDLDNDGDLDVATANTYDGSVSIIPNNGNGTYSTYDFYYVDGWPRAIIHGDVDNDDNLDLITANYLGGSLTICYNDGFGNFDYRYNKTISVEPFSVIVDDFDLDGHIDMASADEGLFEIVIVYNDGDGKFIKRAKDNYDIGGYPYSILYNDYTGDGYKDLVTSNNAQESLSILRNLGNGKFAPYVDYTFENQRPFDMANGNMDGDGDYDIVCTHMGYESIAEHNISIVWNDGTGNFSSHVSYEVGTNPVRVSTVDIDLDGDLDVVVGNMDDNSTTVLMNIDNTTLGDRRDYSVGPTPLGQALVDLNGDGYPDLVTSNYDNDSISILYNKGDGTFYPQTEYIIGALPSYVTVADLNKDGSLDIASANLLTNSISVRYDFYHPREVSVKIGDNNLEYLKTVGSLKEPMDFADFSSDLNSYLSTHSNDYVDFGDGPVVLFPIEISSVGVGVVELFDLEIDYISTEDFDNDNFPDALDLDDDNDGYLDTWESVIGTDPKDQSDVPADTDSDGAPDGDLNNSHSWMDIDDDNDTISDTWELEFDLDPKNAADSTQDFDDDGLTNQQEFENDTSPLEEDTDGDGYSDVKEITDGYDPANPDDHPKKKKKEEPGFLPGFGSEAFIAIIMVLIITVLYRGSKKQDGRR